MILPEPIAACIRLLEEAGFTAWVVGGGVRDACLGRIPADFDLCTSALPEQTQQVFSDYLVNTEGKQHGCIRVFIQDQPVEITTFRQEGGYSDNRHPDWVRFVSRVEEDLARRDFTVNAMAWSPDRGYADPFGGRQDLQAGVLRTVGVPEVRFREDPLRILRGVRFAVRFGFRVEAQTMEAMIRQAHLLDTLSRERVFEELCRLLPTVRAEDLLRFSPVLTAAIPELAPMVDFDQRSPHHAYDLYTHTALVTQGVPQDLTLRWAALLHDIGKIPTFTQDATGRGHYYGHAAASAEMADEILRRFHAPAQLRSQVTVLIAGHMTRLTPDKKQLRRRLSVLGVRTVEQTLLLQTADMAAKGGPDPGGTDQIRQALKEILVNGDCISIRQLALGGRELMAMGYRGKEVGSMLQMLLEQVMDERVNNTREELLQYLHRQEETPKI